MNRRLPKRSVLLLLLSVLTRKVPEQAKQHVQPPHRPAPDDLDAWRAYWKEQGQPWRTEPEIDAKRQQELSAHRDIPPDIEKGIYPFRGMKLSRADVEWLLATHENGRGPVDWSDEHQRNRMGLDLRGADLRQVDLHGLPLARLRGGFNGIEWVKASLEQRHMARLHLESSNLSFAHLEGAYLAGTYLEGANFSRSHLARADLYKAHLEGTYLFKAHLEGASLRNAFLDIATVLTDIILGNEEFGFAFLSDVHWSDANLAIVNWAQVKVLGDEHEAKQPTMWYGQVKDKSERLQGHRRAVRANRQLALALQNQGLNEDAARFAYRAQTLQRSVSWFEMIQTQVSLQKRVQALGTWFFSWFLFLLAGYGYKPARSFLAYLVVIGTFMALYLLLDPHLAWYEALVVSLTAFHGRGFSPSTFSPGDPLSIASATEAFVGLIIEVTFIATLTRRFFGQ